MRIARVTWDRGDLRISFPTDRQLADENRGYADFVVSIKEAMAKGQPYDDSDRRSGLLVYYLPVDTLHVNGTPRDFEWSNLKGREEYRDGPA